ncbi:ubiquitin-conjugating enzyme e2 [Holotrichia oblita]|uniref:Ubiquitin-conjugating enzyme e2 n=1 Tax=Holotrichia oblita TaxID=644536 RepID=A0ACB9SRG6_HOLOL|nr:ubiquitin-conjugating enzyme e2 [Holotrichia oblita]
MLNHPGKSISIYDVSTLVEQTFPLAFTPNNISARFKVSGICPFIFEDHEFLPAEVTNRSYKLYDESIIQEEETSVETPSTSSALIIAKTPEELRLFPKAPPRKRGVGGRKPAKCMIATDSPDFKEIKLQKVKHKKSVVRAKQTVKRVLVQSSSEDELRWKPFC